MILVRWTPSPHASYRTTKLKKKFIKNEGVTEKSELLKNFDSYPATTSSLLLFSQNLSISRLKSKLLVLLALVRTVGTTAGFLEIRVGRLGLLLAVGAEADIGEVIRMHHQLEAVVVAVVGVEVVVAQVVVMGIETERIDVHPRPVDQGDPGLVRAHDQDLGHLYQRGDVTRAVSPDTTCQRQPVVAQAGSIPRSSKLVALATKRCSLLVAVSLFVHLSLYRFFLRCLVVTLRLDAEYKNAPYS